MTADANSLRKIVVSFKGFLARKTRDMVGSPPRPLSYDMLFKDPKDGCARYDDVWGG